MKNFKNISEAEEFVCSCQINNAEKPQEEDFELSIFKGHSKSKFERKNYATVLNILIKSITDSESTEQYTKFEIAKVIRDNNQNILFKKIIITSNKCISYATQPYFFTESNHGKK